MEYLLEIDDGDNIITAEPLAIIEIVTIEDLCDVLNIDKADALTRIEEAAK